jgi:hypothetical protein
MKKRFCLIVVLGLICFLPAAQAAITNVQNASSNQYVYNSSSIQSAAFPNNTVSGDTIIVFEQYGAAGATPTGCSDSQGNAYTQVLNVFDSGMTQGVTLYYAANIVGGATPTVTCTFNNANYLSMSIHEYGGLASSNVLDTASSIDYSGDEVGAMQTSAISPATSGDLIFAGLVEVRNGVGDICSPSGSFSARVNQCVVDGFITEDYVEPIASGISASTTLTPTSGHYVAGIAAFRAAPSSPTAAAPTVPTNLAVSGVTSSSVSLMWTASTASSGVTGYQVFRNGAQVGTSTTPQYTDDQRQRHDVITAHQHTALRSHESQRNGCHKFQRFAQMDGINRQRWHSRL